MIKGFSVASSTTIGLSAFSPALPAQAGNGSAVGTGLVRFGIGAIVGSALSPRQVLHRRLFLRRPCMPPLYYGPVAYGPPPWTPGWYDYCAPGATPAVCG